jgi:ribosomal protein S18 acetylase RimI-like enzyme
MTMDNLVIRAVAKKDLPLLDQALRALSSDLGDAHPADITLLEKAGFGPFPAYHALIALDDKETLFGTAVFSPLFSTTLAATGLYVSDLWVSDSARGAGLGPRLLAHAARSAETLWGAAYLKLAVYHDAPDARRFYDRLGFSARDGETTMFLDQSGFETLKGQA